jgi:hypothetical protein
MSAKLNNPITTTSASNPQVEVEEVELTQDQVESKVEAIKAEIEATAEILSVVKYGLVFDDQESKYSVRINNGEIPVWRIRFYNKAAVRDENGVAVEKAYHWYNKTGKAALSACSRFDEYKVANNWLIVRPAGGVVVNMAEIDLSAIKVMSESKDHTKYIVKTPSGNVLITTRKDKLVNMAKELSIIVNKAVLWVGFDPTGRQSALTSYMEDFYNVLVQIHQGKDIFIGEVDGYKYLADPSADQRLFMHKDKFFYNQPFINSVRETLGSDDPAAVYKQKVHDSKVRKAIGNHVKHELAWNEKTGVQVSDDGVKVALSEKTAETVMKSLDYMGCLEEGGVLNVAKVPADVTVGLRAYKNGARVGWAVITKTDPAEYQKTLVKIQAFGSDAVCVAEIG